jgi:RNA ligase (TIGR02306 family)
MERNLASVQHIVNIEPIEGADNIEVAQVLGWRVVVKKGEYQPDDLVTYLEIDSWVPHTLAPFLTPDGQYPKEYEGVQGQRLRSKKLRGVVSQGLILPVVEGFNEGDDVTEALGIVKWEPNIPANLAGTVKGSFPAFLNKTDEERVQNLGGLLEQYAGTPMYITEKLDGSSMTVYYRDGEFGVCSRNLDLKESEGNSFWQMARQLNLETKMRDFGQNVALQGELVGPGIQKNPLGLDKVTFFVYNVFRIDRGDYLDYAGMQAVVGHFGVQMVPVIETNHELQADTQFYVNYADGRKSVIDPKRLGEGVVVRPLEEITTRYGRFSFKAISNKYLLKNGE